MSILRKSLDTISLGDLSDLIQAGARETGELEFKGALPSRADKGKLGDRWISHGDGIGDHARDEILAELIAFANANGGTLLLGMHETKTEQGACPLDRKRVARRVRSEH